MKPHQAETNHGSDPGTRLIEEPVAAMEKFTRTMKGLFCVSKADLESVKQANPNLKKRPAGTQRKTG